MIRAINRLVMLFLVGVVASSAVFAGTIKKEITFTRPVIVNGTEVRQGTYVAVFDDQTNELSITKGRKVIAKAPARLEKHDGPGKVSFVTREDAGQMILVTVVLKGKNQATIVNADSKAASAQ
jgi:hypothetical protein